MNKILTIAGSDCSGGAGIQADLKTISAHKMYGMSAITALTAQNTTGVSAIFDVDPNFVGQQLDSIFTDIVPDAVKIGMVSKSEIIEVIAEKLKQYKVENVVIDPVMVATSGSKLLSSEAINSVITKLIPLAKIITPNIPEAMVLSNMNIETMDDMINSAKIISKMLGGDVLIKGGHLTDTANDLIYSNGEVFWATGERVNNPNTHGTGCTLSSAIACNLALGFDTKTSVINAKKYVTGALKSNLDLGKGSGPLDHLWNIK